MQKMVIESYDLNPTNGRKSFYGKAKVFIDNEGVKYLRSYDTIHCSIDRDDKVHRFSDYKSNTTCCHLKSFLGGYKYKGYWKLPLEERTTLTVNI